MPQNVTSIIYQINLEQLDLLKQHSDEVSEVVGILAQARSESGSDDALYEKLATEAIEQAGFDIDATVIRAVQAHSYDLEKIGGGKTTLVLPPHHAAITLSSKHVGRVSEIDDLGVKMFAALDADGKNNAADGMSRGAHTSKLASAFVLSADDCDYGGSFSCFESVVMNRGQISERDNPNTPTSITILYEGGHPTTFASGVKTDYPYDVAP